MHAVKCKSLSGQLQSVNASIRVSDYSDPALVGTNVTFECSSANLVFIGPNMSRCMGNGEWEPDPREVKCVGK